MNPRDALLQIGEIRRQLARSETFRGYRSATVGFSGLLALAGAAAQAIWISSPNRDVGAYLALWIVVAAVSLGVVAAELAIHCRRSASPLRTRLTLLAAEQFLPAVIAGGLLTFALIRVSPAHLWMLPGLWSIVYSLGVFASCRLLPRWTYLVAAWYLLAGVVLLVLPQASGGPSPWAMAGSFGAGQLLAAAVLYFTLERRSE